MKDFLNKDIFNEKKPIWLQIFKGYTLIGSMLIFIIANILAIVTAVYMANGLIWFVIFFVGTLLTVINLFVGMLILHFGHHIATISACSKRSLAIQLAEYNHKYKNLDDVVDIDDEIESSEEFKTAKNNKSNVEGNADSEIEKKTDTDIDSIISDTDFD